MPLVKSGWRVAATPAQSPRGRRLSAGRFSVVMIHVLGIDAGGTKTVCQLADEQGTLVSEARAGGANLQAAGELHVEKVIHDVMEEAIGDRDIVPAAICLGIAGVDRAEDSTIVRGLMRRIGFKARTLVVNDALVALEAGAPGAPGVVIISGTGSIAYGRNQQNQGARAGGWGHVLGDEGSGYWIGRAALRAVLREADRRGPRTALTPLLLRHFGVSEAQNLIHEVYQSKLRPAAIGALAQCVQAAFTEGDNAAQGILRAAADELESSGSSVATRLRLGGSPFTFILGGGIFRAVPWLREEMQTRLGQKFPTSVVRLLDREPAAGAVSLALQEAHGGARIPGYITG
jgi:N-acetylglucosamine kinase-like BadF-type ATPase